MNNTILYEHTVASYCINSEHLRSESPLHKILEHATMARQFHVVPPKLWVAPQNAMMSNNLQVRMRNPGIFLYAFRTPLRISAPKSLTS